MADRSFHLSLFASLLFLALVVLLLVYHGLTRYQQFHIFQQTNVRTVASGVATEVGHFIAERQRMVKVFANEHLQTLAQVVTDEETTEANLVYLHRRAKQFFPDYFTITVLDEEMRPVIDDFDGLLGDLCLEDTRHILTSNNYKVRIHPNPVAYHFDVVSPWQKDNVKGVFFISFHADFLGRLLKGRQIPGHQLLLVDKAASNLIEVTPDGARINWVRDDYRLQAAELKRVLTELAVPNSRWHVLALHEPGLFQQELKRIVIESFSIFCVFATIILIALWILRREAYRRQRAEQAKDEFVSLFNHELRTPLTAIRGGLGLIANGVTGKLEEKTQEIAGLALNNAEHLSQLVDDLLDMQKLNLGRLEFHKEKVNLIPLVEHALNNYRSYADRFGATYRLTQGVNDCYVYADPHRIEQVLANLLSNAAKYGADNDEIEVAVTEEMDKVRISITDHGSGIPVEFQSRLFHAFEQAGNKREHVVRGTGLGLYIAKAIVQEHNGEIGFVTEAGKGTSFWFDLPVSGVVG